MKKILVGLVLFVFCLSLTSAFAARKKERVPATRTQAYVKHIELPSEYYVLILRIPLETYDMIDSDSSPKT